MVKAELAELNSGAPMNPGDPEIRCHYLEKLLGNYYLYIYLFNCFHINLFIYYCRRVLC